MVEYARFLVDRKRLADAGRTLGRLREIVEGTGAVLLERQVAELWSRVARA
jgi:hypothetical protein